MTWLQEKTIWQDTAKEWSFSSSSWFFFSPICNYFCYCLFYSSIVLFDIIKRCIHIYWSLLPHFHRKDIIQKHHPESCFFLLNIFWKSVCIIYRSVLFYFIIYVPIIYLISSLLKDILYIICHYKWCFTKYLCVSLG